MKKIISGMFFRLFKGMEFWVLIVLLLVSSFFVGYSRFKDQDYFLLDVRNVPVSQRKESSFVRPAYFVELLLLLPLPERVPAYAL